MFLRDTADGKYSSAKVNTRQFGFAAADLKLAGHVLLDSSLRVGAGCSIGPDVIVGRNVVLGDGVTLKRCTVMDGTRIDSNASVKSSIVAYNCVLHVRTSCLMHRLLLHCAPSPCASL
jgi:mannose-1-phosphate guanylyltransferase